MNRLRSEPDETLHTDHPDESALIDQEQKTALVIPTAQPGGIKRNEVKIYQDQFNTFVRRALEQVTDTLGPIITEWTTTIITEDAYDNNIFTIS